MPANYVLLEKVTVGAAGAASVTFNSIPQTGYTDLKVVFSARGADNFNDIQMSFNGLATNRSQKRITGTGASIINASDSTFYMLQVRSSYTASTFSSCEVYIPNYTSANYKSFIADQATENNNTTSTLYALAGLWSSTAAINSITFTPDGSSIFAQHSTFSLYGIAALNTTPVITPKATGGDTIQTDGTYWYHAFLATGSFTPAIPLSCDVLVVAGGGGGGGPISYLTAAGGGGAGGYRSTTGLSVAASANTVTVGAGGAGAAGTAYPGATGTNGNNSVFSSITSTGGGGGAGYSTSPNTGGSGGGGGAYGGSGAASSPVTSPVQGFAGGNSFNSATTSSGGGGATAVGVNGSSATVSGAGGAGSNALSTWLSTTGLGVSGYVAGGGGGGNGATASTGNAGVGGAGGGGRGGTGVALALAGTANTGGGGGGGGWADTGTAGKDGQAGGSGLVIIRYTIA
jgi:hypothetical protein